MRRWMLMAVIASSACNVGAKGVEPAQLAPLHNIPTENRSPEPLPRDRPARVRLSGPDMVSLAGVLGVSLPANQHSFEYVINQYPQLYADQSRTWLEPTFVIDYNEPEFEPLRKELDSLGAKVSRAQIVHYVAGLVEDGNERDWDIASVVARRRTGDCSEHAVLTVALARMHGIPARVALGIALVSSEKGHSAFGHAWAEILEGGLWKVSDAALYGVDATVRYVPIGVMEDEGMGYLMGLMQPLQMWVDRLVVLGPG